nr:putative mating-type 1-1-1 R protein [Davidsoniella virescens]
MSPSNYPTDADDGEENILELLQTLSNAEVMCKIPTSAAQNVNRVNHLIRSGHLDPKSIFTRKKKRKTPAHHASTPIRRLERLMPRRESNVQAALSTVSLDEVEVIRPVNAYIVFRSYYQKIVPHLPQKSISALMATLWKTDPFQSRWMLIARVYSFIRNTIGKPKVKLCDFLDVAAPSMHVPQPDDYLIKLCWVYSANEAGQVTFFQDDLGLKFYVASLEKVPIPNADQELLVHCLVRHYLPEHANTLLTNIAKDSSSIITAQNDWTMNRQPVNTFHNIFQRYNGQIIQKDIVRTASQHAAYGLIINTDAYFILSLKVQKR